MAGFLDQLSELLDRRRDELAPQLATEASHDEATLARFVNAHWSPLPAPQAGAVGVSPTNGSRQNGLTLADADETPSTSPLPEPPPAFAIDGSIHQENLDSGHYVYIAQALCLGSDAYTLERVDFQVLPSATPREQAGRFADLLQRSHELGLACDVAENVPEGSVIFMDGALYGLLPQLYPGEGLVEDFRRRVLEDYLRLMDIVRRRDLHLVAVAKTSREATHCRLWLDAAGDDLLVPDELSDAEMIHRWTDSRAGLSTPVVLGRRGFTGGSRDLLAEPGVARSPAIASFFVRLADYDDALRIDVPATELGATLAIDELDAKVLEAGAEAAHEVVRLLIHDYGGTEVYNALLFTVDREVRLKRQQVRDLYLPVVEQSLGVELRRNRSERRF